MLARALALLALLAAAPVLAEEVVAGLSQNRVSITANFDGSEILIFGAVKREAPAPAGGPLHVVITVAGPDQPVMVRRKARQYGIWINTDAVEVDAAPSFYAVATDTTFEDAVSDTEDLRNRISIARAIRSVGAPMTVVDAPSFTDALVRIRSRNGLYQDLPNSVELAEETLYRTSIALPANLIEGEYRVRIFLTREGRIVDAYETLLDVRKVGLERALFNLAHQIPLAYGILSLAIAIAAGWGASAVFRYLRT